MEQKEHGGLDHSGHHRMIIRDFRRRFYITVVLSIPVLALAELIQKALGYSLTYPGASSTLEKLAQLMPNEAHRKEGEQLIGQSVRFSIARMATVMIITCPHALGLAIPLVVSVSTAKSAQNGLLIQNRTAFENARKITTVLFDKTGTLTKGTFEVAGVNVHSNDFDEESILTLAAATEGLSEHPIGKGIVARAKQQGIEIAETDDFQAIKGKGVSGTVKGKSVQVVSPGYLDEKGLTKPKEAAAKGGVTLVFIVIDGVVKKEKLSTTDA